MNVTRSKVVAAVLAMMAVSMPAGAADEQADTKRIQQVFETYLASVAAADPELASRVWSQTGDVIAVTPFGRFRGWDSVKTDIYVNFLRKGFSDRHLEPSNVSIHVNGDTAWLVFDWTFTGKLPNGQPITSKGWESHIYRRTPNGWALMTLHYSVPPAAAP